MKVETYTQTGEKSGSVAVPERVFDAPWNATLVHEVVRAIEGNARQNTAHTKTRGEVRGSGRKPWRQKGTGRARAGSRRSPIWRGGGVTFGPRAERDYSRKINRKVRARALFAALSQKVRDREVLFLSQFSFDASKSKDAKAALGALARVDGFAPLAYKRKNTALIVLPKRDEQVEKSFRNFGNLLVTQAKDLNPLLALTYKYTLVVEPMTVGEMLAKRGA